MRGVIPCYLPMVIWLFGTFCIMMMCFVILNFTLEIKLYNPNRKIWGIIFCPIQIINNNRYIESLRDSKYIYLTYSIVFDLTWKWKQKSAPPLYGSNLYTRIVVCVNKIFFYDLSLKSNRFPRAINF